MKKVIIGVLACIASFYAGFSVCHNTEIREIKEANEYKRGVIFLQSRALDDAHTIMELNGTFDIDGSDIMSDYLETMDSINLYVASEL